MTYSISKDFLFNLNQYSLKKDEAIEFPELIIISAGHTYKATFFFKSKKLDENHFVLDLADLNPIKEYINTELSCSRAFDVFDLRSQEYIANLLYDKFKLQYPFLYKVNVVQIPKKIRSYIEESQEYTFDSAHKLDHLPEGHKCRNLHGHTYKTIFFFKNEELDEDNYVLDLLDLKPIKEYIDTQLDHQYLNDVFDFPTTIENIAKFLYDKFKPEYKFLYKVSVAETPKSKGEYTEEE
jgi:6-pyruvoyltetrahydropterin/6-carboxytetrahydropterin synthase